MEVIISVQENGSAERAVLISRAVPEARVSVENCLVLEAHEPFSREFREPLKRQSEGNKHGPHKRRLVLLVLRE